MVFSNKKLRQKVREELSVEAVVLPGERQSPRSVLHSTGKKHRLSKRKKRRKVGFLGGKDETGEGEKKVGVEGLTERSDFEGVEEEEKGNGKDKKRKRVEEDDGGKKGSNKMLSKQKKKQEKKKKNKGNKGEGYDEGSDWKEEYSNGFENGVMQGNGQETGHDAKKVYVGGIPYYSSEDDIRTFFEGCGTITKMDCLTFPESESGKFRTEAAAKRALALNGSDVGGLFLKIKPYKSSRTTKSSYLAIPVVEGYNRIYIGNLSCDITEDDVKSFFLGCSISSIRFGMDYETEEFKGYAHVDFSNNRSTAAALKLDQHILCGRPVKVTRAIPNKKSKPETVPIPQIM